MKIIVLSPHRDDAAFSLGLTIEKWLEKGHQVQVVNCFTRSEYGPFGDLDQVHTNDRRSYVTALREREDLRWSRSYKFRVELIDLRLRDAPQRLQCSVNEVCTTPVRPNDLAIVKIQEAIKKRAPDLLVLPLAIGNHVDHLTARVAAQEGLSESLPVAFYEDLPYAARPEAATDIVTRVESVAHALEASFVCPRGDVAAAVERKRCLALCYDSQIDSEATMQIARFCERYQGRERLWGNHAWREAGLGTPD